MSLVTTPRRASADSAPQSAAIRLLLPEPTGPPTPIRSARSTGKESLSLFEVDGGGELERDGRGRGQRAVVGGDRPRGASPSPAPARRASARSPPGRAAAASARRRRRSRRRRRARAARCPRPRRPAAAATTPSASGRGVSRDAARYAAIGSPGQTVAAERSSCAPSRRAASRSTGLGQRAAHSASSRASARSPSVGRAPRLHGEARVGLGHQPQPRGDERRHVGQPVGDRLLEPQRVGVGARREAGVREQERERVHAQNSE